jgi:hypothetical protein
MNFFVWSESKNSKKQLIRGYLHKKIENKEILFSDSEHTQTHTHNTVFLWTGLINRAYKHSNNY